MGVIEQSVINGWLARMPTKVPGKPSQPVHRLGPGEIPCPYCGAPALPFKPFGHDTLNIEGLYQCDPFVEGSCMRMFVPKPAPFPPSVERLIGACELAVKNVSSRGRTSSVRRAALDALCAVDSDLAEMKRKEQS